VDGNSNTVHPRGTVRPLGCLPQLAGAPPHLGRSLCILESSPPPLSVCAATPAGRGAPADDGRWRGALSALVGSASFSAIGGFRVGS